MSKGLRLHNTSTSGGVYVVAEVPGVGIILATGATVPSDAELGFAPGCLFIQNDGSTEATIWYANVGTLASANFDAVDLNIAEAALLTGLTASAAELNITDGLLATTTELNNAADNSTRIVNVAATPLAVTVAAHAGKIIELDLAAGIAVTLPSLAASSGAEFNFVVKTTFTGAASIKSVASGDIMVGHAIMGNNSDNTTVRWPAVAADTFDTIDLLGTANSTGGIEGQTIKIRAGTGRWYVEIVGDAAGTEATPFANTV